MAFGWQIWRIIVAIKDFMVLVALLLFFALIYAGLSASGNVGGVHPGALLLKLDGRIVEQTTAPDLTQSLAGDEDGQDIQLRDLVRALDAAASDSRVKAVVLDLSGFQGGGQVALERVGAALDGVRNAKKPVFAYSGGYDDAAYLLAAHASEIWLDPMGFAVFAGPGGQHLYYKGLIDKLGANVHVYRVGKYKSFVEPYTRTNASPEAKEANRVLLTALYNDWVDNVYVAHPNQRLKEYLTHPQAPDGDLAGYARKMGVVDRLGDPYAFGARVASLAGNDDDGVASHYAAIRMADLLAANPAEHQGAPIAVVTVAGDIIDGKSVGDSAGGDTIAHQIERVVADKSVRALVLRVDSPGGSVAASEKIRLALMQAKARHMPIIASMGSVAASGGYWITTAADTVLAEPATITGSIGVFGIIPTFEKSLAKLGITHDGLAATALSGQPDIFSGTTKDMDTLVQTEINAIYKRFVMLVSQSRHLPVATVEDNAQGRVWAGSDALKLKLVNGMGTLDDAIAEAARRAGLNPEAVHPVYIEDSPGVLQTLSAWFNIPHTHANTDPLTRLVRMHTGQLGQALADVQNLIAAPVVQVRCLDCPLTPTRPHTPGQTWQTLLRAIMS
ncbi:MAG: signal peptide peptidase SppA [Alphaproteobacteria bacterium]|nr:signal peptide peptidase SppA [Alphaproteobacteria bacterium]